MKQQTKKLTTLAMICTLAYLVMVIIRIPLVPALPFLNYDPKDVILMIGGFMYGPLSALLCTLVVALVEMVTVSDTGIIGCIMNFLSTASFVGIAATIYKKKHTKKGAVVGLICGVCIMTAVMLLWNYAITPLYMETPREVVASMLVPVFLPFNLLKGGLNAALTFLLYKPVVTALRKTTLLPKAKNTHRFNPFFIGAAILVIISCVLFILALKGII